MPDLIQFFQRRGRSLIVWLLAVWAVAVLVLWFQPVKYKSETTSVASNLYATDPGRIFRTQIQQLYAPLGESDQLDLLVGSGQLDSVYRPLVRRFNLVEHYSLVESGEHAFTKAVYRLKKNADVYKSDHGELKVRVWDTDPSLAAQLANAITEVLNTMHRDLISTENLQTRAALQRALTQLELSSDSLSETERLRFRSLYQNLIQEYSLLLEQRPSAIHVLDPAVPAVFPDKPDWVLTLGLTTAVALLVWLMFSLWSERRTIYGL